MMRRVIPWLLLLPALAFAGLGAGGAAERAAEYQIKVWQTDDGLPSGEVTDVTQSADGYLWIATSMGLARFDGVRFVPFTGGTVPELRAAEPVRLLGTKDGTLWICLADGRLVSLRGGRFRGEWVPEAGAGLLSGLVRQSADEILFSLKSRHLLQGRRTAGGGWQWATIATPGTPDDWRCGADAGGQVFCLTEDGRVARLKGQVFEPVSGDTGLAGERVITLRSDSAGRVWVGTEKEVAVWSGGRFTTMTPVNGEAELNVEGMLAAGDGTMWISANGRTRRCRGREWVADAGAWTGRSEPLAASVGYFGDREGGQWSYTGHGLIHLRADGMRRRIQHADGLPNARPTCWYEDREGNVWVGFDRGGLARVLPRRFEVVGAAQGLTDPVVLSLCEDIDGALWLGTGGGGVHRWQHGMLSPDELGASGGRGLVHSLVAGKTGELHAAVEQGGVLERRDGKWENLLPTQHAGSPVHALWRDARGGLWIGGSEGLACWQGGVLRKFGAAEGFPGGIVQAGAEAADGTMWIGMKSGALLAWREGKFTAFQPDDALATLPVWTLLPDADGSVWMGTRGGGLLWFKDGRFTRCTRRQGLPSDVICQVLDDAAGQLWLGTQGGIARLNKSGVQALARGEAESVLCVSYDRRDGLPTGECSGGFQPAGVRAGDGRLWFATARGAVGVDAARIRSNPLPPPVVIEGVTVDGTAVELPAGGPLTIGPGRHFVEFRFTGLSLRAADKIRFQYQLAGLHDDWTASDTLRTASYAYLPAGPYTFRVRACNDDGVWNETGAALSLRVVPFFWQTPWFLWTSGLGLLTTVGGLIRFVEKRRLHARMARLEQARLLERERARIAQDLHDDLGTSLTEISLLGTLARRSSATKDQITGHLQEITTRAGAMVGALDEIVWAVSPAHDSVASVASYFCQFADRFLHSASLRCRFEIAPQWPALVLDPEQRHHLFLAFKEALNNVVRHSGAEEVLVRMELAGGAMLIAVEDNGQGLGTGLSAEGADGLRNMRERLAAVGGKCEIQSAPGAGTTVRFTLPLPLPKS